MSWKDFWVIKITLSSLYICRDLDFQTDYYFFLSGTIAEITTILMDQCVTQWSVYFSIFLICKIVKEFSTQVRGFYVCSRETDCSSTALPDFSIV